jgi:hypothetical protein
MTSYAEPLSDERYVFGGRGHGCRGRLRGHWHRLWIIQGHGFQDLWQGFAVWWWHGDAEPRHGGVGVAHWGAQGFGFRHSGITNRSRGPRVLSSGPPVLKVRLPGCVRGGPGGVIPCPAPVGACHGPRGARYRGLCSGRGPVFLAPPFRHRGTRKADTFTSQNNVGCFWPFGIRYVNVN